MATVGIIGAGITGPSAALALVKAGHTVTVYEQRPADALHSTGILGITPHNWAALTALGVDLTAMEVKDNLYREYTTDSGLTAEVRSPFKFVIWTDLHDAITRCAHDAGAQFRFQVMPVTPAQLGTDYTIDAGGITTAARRGLPNKYIGSYIYRAVSPMPNPWPGFTTYKLPDKYGFLDLSTAHQGGAWAFGVRRPEPKHHRTTMVDTVPWETALLPDEMRRVVQATREPIMALPQYAWTAPKALNDPAWRNFTLGDANGSVRALTTSGANLGIMAGLSSPRLVAGDTRLARTLLRRRAYALALGLRLTGPEIGGPLEDSHFSRTQRMLYGTAGAKVAVS